MASNLETEARLTKTVAELRPWEGANLKVSGVEILQRMQKLMVWITGKPEDTAIVLRRLEGFNPTPKTASWHIVRHEKPQEANATWRSKHLLVVQVPESQARASAGLYDRELEEPAIETERCSSPKWLHPDNAFLRFCRKA